MYMLLSSIYIICIVSDGRIDAYKHQTLVAYEVLFLTVLPETMLPVLLK